MGIYKKGGNQIPSGKTGRQVSYELNGQMVSRTIGIVANRTEKQRENEAKMKLITSFLDPFKSILKIGLEHSPRKRTENTYNLAFNIHRKTAITGTYPNLTIDLSKVRFSLGILPQPLQASVIQQNGGLKLSWQANLQQEHAEETDQTMLVAYFPESGKTIDVINGAVRMDETQLIKLPTVEHHTIVEIFMAFIAADRKNVSDTLYLGQLIWNAKH